MKQQPRIYYTETDKTLMWDRWQKGESQSSIARHFGRGHSSVQRILGETGGIRPAQKRRSRLALTLSERDVEIGGKKANLKDGWDTSSAEETFETRANIV